MIPAPVARHGRVAALGLLLALGACVGAPTPTATPAPEAAAPIAPRPAPAAATPAASPATAGPRATATRAATADVATAARPAATVPATTPATPTAAGPRATTEAATARVAAVTATPADTPAATPRGYAPGDPCAAYAAGAVPALRRAVAAAPARLCIPALFLSAAVVPVGATPGGAMAEPPDPWAVGWYAPGPPPGALGNAALAGAVDARGVGPAVFRELALLRPGDRIVVVDAAGVARRFAVLETVVYPRADTPLTRIFGAADDANLALITGAGAWDPAQGAYDGTRIVFARLHP